ncbi:MAG: T9SS type A sorting domain-containing protein [Candidatus Poribacteria bacterium]|nr:T9SS type A sorting domain-containing protein [Candidatus Poribacteria bacterium]
MPIGTVVVLGTDVPVPNVLVEAHGQGSEDQLISVSAITDQNGEYRFPKRLSGDDLEFRLLIPDRRFRQRVRPEKLVLIKSVAPDAVSMPTLEVGAINTFETMNLILDFLKATNTANELHKVMAEEYREELTTLDAFLEAATQSGLWGESLQQTPEEFYRLFLAVRLMLSTRPEAEKLTEISTAAISTAFAVLIKELFSKAIEDLIQEGILTAAFSIFGSEAEAQEFVRTTYINNVLAFDEYIVPLLENLMNYFNIRSVGLQDQTFDFLTKAWELAAGVITDVILARAETSDGPLGLRSPREMKAILQMDLKEFIFRQYARATDNLITEMVAKAATYAGPDSAGSLSFSAEQVDLIKFTIRNDVDAVENTTRNLLIADQFLQDFNEGLGNWIIVTTIGSATLAAPVSAPVALTLSRIKKVTEWLQLATTGAAAFPAPLQLFDEMPKQLRQGINAAFDMPTTTPRPSRRMVAGTNGMHSHYSTRRARDFSDYREQLQAVRDLVAMDDFEAVRAIYNEQFLPADRKLSEMLKQDEALLYGAAATSFMNQSPGAEALYSAFADTLIDFRASRLVLPWAFALYAIVGELEGGSTNPEFPAIKQDLLETIDVLLGRSQTLEPALSSSLQGYDMQGIIPRTAIVDSLWFNVDGGFSQRINSVPAAITVYGRVRNLASSALSGLNITLQENRVDGLMLDAGQDSTMLLPELGPADNAKGGSDEFTATWNLTYDGSLSEREGVLLTLALAADTSSVYTGLPTSRMLAFLGADLDEDGMPDEYEVTASLDPSRDDASEDPDQDFLTNVQEYLIGTIPRDSDSDDDGIVDGIEIDLGSDPLNNSSPVSEGTAALILPANIEVEGDNTTGIRSVGIDSLILPVSVSSVSPVTSLQFTVDYDSTILELNNVTLAPGLFSFTLDTVNTNPGFTSSTAGTNKNLLVRLSSSNNSFTGNGIEVAILELSAIANIDTAHVSFDRDSEHTFLIDQDNAPISIVSFTDAILSTQLPVSVEDPEPQLPIQFALEQNYPNPFNPNTTIRYQLPASGDVKLEIFNVLGQRVRTLVDQAQVPGHYAINWDSKNHHGLPVATGMYFYRIVVGDFIKTRKMLLLK